MGSQIEIFDNFISQKELAEMNLILFGDTFPWFYYPYKTGKDEASDPRYNFQFVHTFYDVVQPRSNYFLMLDPIFAKIEPMAIIRVKGNLTTRTEERVTFGYHVDFQQKAPLFKTAIFYVNSNDGVTLFEDGTEVESVANRLVIFDPTLKHTGTTCTDEKARVVLNFNYYE